MNLENYELVRNSIKTGDLIAFKGKGLISDIIEKYTNSQYSHIGMCLWITGLASKDRLFIIESTTLNNIPDVRGQYERGIQLSPLGQRLQAYDGDAWWIPLKHALNKQEETTLITWSLSRFYERIPYDTEQAILSGVDIYEKSPLWLRWFVRPFLGWTQDQEDLKKMFCSEFCTVALQLVNRVPKDINPSEQTPKDVANFDCLLKPFKL